MSKIIEVDMVPRGIYSTKLERGCAAHLSDMGTYGDDFSIKFYIKIGMKSKK